jgi:hypothetical protein
MTGTPSRKPAARRALTENCPVDALRIAMGVLVV